MFARFVVFSQIFREFPSSRITDRVIIKADDLVEDFDFEDRNFKVLKLRRDKHL